MRIYDQLHVQPHFKQMMGVTPVEWRKRPENYEQRLLNYEIHTEKGW